jgi:hypothetical protein
MMVTERQSVRMPDKMSETVVSTVFPLQVTALREHRDQAAAVWHAFCQEGIGKCPRYQRSGDSHTVAKA